MAHKKPCAKYQYVVTPTGPKILPVEEPSCKDEESPADYNAGGYLPVKVNDTFKNNRYRVVRKLGWGHFSTVWLVKDSQSQRHSALKVVKSAGRYAETARDEIKLLSRVQSFSPTHPGRSHIVSFLDSFSHQGPESTHICIVFEPLGENLLALIERHKKKGVPRALVRVIAKQILFGLEYLHDECDLVHTDIKPENILISIPDIENHIQAELSLSPGPTSRRVGVPLPTKSRVGMTIPHLQQHSRRQVQIFNSQPLASPTRSLGRASYSGLSLNARQSSGSGSNSVSGSYGSLMQVQKAYPHTAGSTAGVASSIPKVPSNLSFSAPIINDILKVRGVEVGNTKVNVPDRTGAPLPQPKFVADSSSSTSSSSSSIASITASTAAGSSNISTPPTSLSQSLGMIRLPIKVKSRDDLHPFIGSLSEAGINVQMGLPVSVSSLKGKARAGLESELGDAMFSSCQGGHVGSRDKNSLFDSMDVRVTCEADSKGHARLCSQSGTSVAGFWKDPGVAAPAPAVVVSAVVGAVGADGDCLQLSNTSIQAEGDNSGTDSNGTSENSSATATVAHPSPQRGPSIKSKTTSLLNGVHRIITSNLFHHDCSTNISGKDNSKTDGVKAHKSTQCHGPSLLTQTAPLRHSPIPGSSIATRVSPPRQLSHLSAHIHKHRPSSCKCTDPEHKHRSITNEPRKSTKFRGQPGSKDVKGTPIHPHPTSAIPVTISPTSITPTPASPSPRAPPPTPCENILSGMASAIGSSATIYCEEPEHDNLVRDPTLQTDVLAPSALPPISIKIADLGNATPSTKHFTDDIQTRQYRAPEAILGRREWDARVDIWSVACVVFELLTAEYLFDPQGQGELFTKDDDHMAQIIELMGDFPMEVKMGGKYSRELFDHTGALRYIRTLKPWPLKRVMVEKYLYTDSDSTALCEFLKPMLAVDMRQRARARDMKTHEWLEPAEADEVVTDW
ncbi:hypothetical protein AX17_000758 [Amanita inopinata Kibby_2008]|nr:hypothetical protein AX17_000758 [Amanita inopinata Kibby_2008]